MGVKSFQLFTPGGVGRIRNKHVPRREDKKMKAMFQKKFYRMNKRSGQALVEYALILALISVVAILVLKGIGTNASKKLEAVNSNLT